MKTHHTNLSHPDRTLCGYWIEQRRVDQKNKTQISTLIHKVNCTICLKKIREHIAAKLKVNQ